MRLFARSIIRDAQLLEAFFLRWINIAHRQISREYIIPALNNGDPVALTPIAVSNTNQKFYLPYDFSAVISFQDQTSRSLDPILSLDVRQYGEYNSFGTFVAFYEYCSSNITPLADSGNTPITLAITNRSTTATASAAVFASTHVGEWLLPLERNTVAGLGNPEDYAYLISAFTSTTVVTLARPFRGVLNDDGSVSNLATSYFEVRPRNTRIVRVWGQPGSTTTINLEYQRKPSKLANDEDVPEDERLSEAIVLKAIELAGWAYQNAFHAKKSPAELARALAGYVLVSERDKLLIHNFITSNPNNRSYSQLGGGHMGQMDRYDTSGINY